jgi:hypothetical protein
MADNATSAPGRIPASIKGRKHVLTPYAWAPTALGEDPDGHLRPIQVDPEGNISPLRDGTVFASQARTATHNSPDLINPGARGLLLVINVTASSATPSVVFTIQGKDPASGTYYTILASTAITGAGQTILRVHPDLTAAANQIAKDILPRTWRVLATHDDTDSITYSTGFSTLS